MIRQATYPDIPPLIDLYRRWLADMSRFGGADVTLDEEWTKQALSVYIGMQWKEQPGGTFFLVSERSSERLDGVFLGFLERFYLFGDKLSAMELQFFLMPEADKKDAMNMIRTFIAYANSIPDVIIARIGSAVGDPEKVARLGKVYGRLGFEPVGASFEKRVH